MRSGLGCSRIFVVVVSLALFSMSCKPSGDGNGASGSDKRLRLAFVANNTANFWTYARRGVEKADAELPNVEVEFRTNPDGSAAEQQRVVDDLLAKGIKGMAISPVDPKNQVQMINRAASQALVFTQDSDATDSDRVCYIGTDNVAAGRQAGELIKEALPQGGNIMLFVGARDAQNARDRQSGIEKALEGSNIKILSTLTDDADPTRAKANAATTLVKYPDIAALVGLWSYNGPAILGAVRDAGKIGKVKIVCFDEEDETLAGVKDGSIYATVVQQPYRFGYQSIQIMAKVLGGDRSEIPASKQIFIPTQAIKQNNAEEFIKEINRLREGS